MIRPSIALCGQLLLSAAFSLALIPVAHAQSSDAPAAEQPAAESSQPASPDAPSADAPASDTSANASPDTPTATPVKNLESIPADGLGDTAWLSGATRIVREITQKRPNEDLVICIAGCVERQDRVVFAQPSELMPKKPNETMSDAGSAAAPSPKAVPAALKPDESAAVPKPGPSAEPAPATAPAATAQDAKPAIAKAATAAAASELKKSEFEPSMSEPAASKPAEMKAPAADAAAPKADTAVKPEMPAPAAAPEAKPEAK
jgi:hypothetical protein